MDEIIRGVIAAAIYSGVCAFVKLLARRYRRQAAPETDPKDLPKNIKAKFLMSLILLVILLPVGVSPPGGVYSLRVLAFAAAGVAFLSAWGCFELTLALNPANDEFGDGCPQGPSDAGAEAGEEKGR